MSIVTKKRTYDFEVVKDEDIESLLFTFQTMMLRRNRKMPFYTVGKFLWKRIRYRLVAGAKRCNENYINYVWKKLVLGLTGARTLNEDEDIMRQPSLKEFVLRKRIWELENEESGKYDRINASGNITIAKFNEIMGVATAIVPRRRAGISIAVEPPKPLSRSTIRTGTMFKKRRSVILGMDENDALAVKDLSKSLPSRWDFKDKSEHGDKTSSIDLKSLFHEIGPHKGAR
jgi:hypothetical protein